MQGFFHADVDGGAEEWSLIFYSWGFMAFCLSCQSSVCAVWCACVWELQASHLRPAHTYWTHHQIAPHRKEKNKSMPASVWGRVCPSAHTHIHEDIGWSCRGLSRLEGVSSTVCNPPPTMYDPFVFCDRRGRKKRLFKDLSKLLLRVQNPHSQSTCC